jgi:hypothetical protein
MLKCVNILTHTVDGDMLKLKYAKKQNMFIKDLCTKPHCSCIQLFAGTIIS